MFHHYKIKHLYMKIIQNYLNLLLKVIMVINKDFLKIRANPIKINFHLFLHLKIDLIGKKNNNFKFIKIDFNYMGN